MRDNEGVGVENYLKLSGVIYGKPLTVSVKNPICSRRMSGPVFVVMVNPKSGGNAGSQLISR